MTTDAPSSTATMILRSLVLQARDPLRVKLMPGAWNEANERMLKATDPDAEGWLKKVKSPIFRRANYALENLLLPGVQLHYILRKRFIEDLARDGINKEDFTQVVNIAAGLDSLCYRLHWEFPSVNFFELDHPATQGIKRRGLDTLGFSSSLTLLPIDLRRATLADTLLSEPAFDRNAPTLFIAEGVMMYLDLRVIQSIFDTVYHHSGPGSSLVFTFIEHAKTAGGGTALLRWWLKKKSESIVWAVARESLEDFIGRHLMDLDQIVDSETLRETYLRPAGLEKMRSATGELIAVATRP